MKSWLEINIKINGFTYAVREEVENISEIKDKGIEIANRLQNIVNNRENKFSDLEEKIKNHYKNGINLPFMCKIRPGANYWINDLSDGPHTYYPFLGDLVFKANPYSNEFRKLEKEGWNNLIVRTEDVIQLLVWNWNE